MFIYLEHYIVKPCEITHVNGSLATKQNTVTATFSVDDSRASFLCQLDGERFAPCKYHISMSNAQCSII